MNKKIITIVSLIGILIILTFFIYQWRHIGLDFKKEIKQRESLIKQLTEIKKSSFIQCRELKTPPKEGVAISLLGVWEKDWSRQIWKLIVIEPEGYGVGIKDIFDSPLREAPTMEMHTPGDIDEDGTLDATVLTGSRKIGDYLIIVEPTSKILSTDTYSLQIGDLILAKNVPFSLNLLDRVYILRQTEIGIIPIIPVSIGCQY